MFRECWRAHNTAQTVNRRHSWKVPLTIPIISPYKYIASHVSTCVWYMCGGNCTIELPLFRSTWWMEENKKIIIQSFVARNDCECAAVHVQAKTWMNEDEDGIFVPKKSVRNDCAVKRCGWLWLWRQAREAAVIARLMFVRFLLSRNAIKWNCLNDVCRFDGLQGAHHTWFVLFRGTIQLI